MVDTIVFDVDGTLVDTTYLHVLAWTRAFGAVGVDVPAWQVHGYMGMGGDQLVGAVAGAAVEHAVGDEIRDRWRENFGGLLSEARPFPEAAETLDALRHRGLQVVLATSGEDEHIARTLEILEIRPLEFPVVTSSAVRASKPAPDLVSLALSSVGARSGILVGDSVWDVQAGGRAGIPVIGVLTGGIAPERLRGAGALWICDDVAAVGEDADRILGVAQRMAVPAGR